MLRPLGFAAITMLALGGCVVDRSAISAPGVGDTGTAEAPDAQVEDAPVDDAPGLDAPLSPRTDAFVADLDAPAVPDDAFAPRDDAYLAPDAASGCTVSPEVCNARDDDCNGMIDETGCGFSIGVASISCEGFVYERHVYQACKASTGLSFDAARGLCQARGPYDLLRLDSYAEGSTVAPHLMSDGWIGLTDRTTEGTFAWVTDATNDTLGDWASSEPDSSRGGGGDTSQNCVVMRSSGRWADLDCGEIAVLGGPVILFVCEAAIVR